MAIYLISDHHFAHANIIRYCNRPFRDVHEMNSVMIARWNETVKPEDTVFHLGDLSMGMGPDRQRELLAALHGTKILVRGNHDRSKKTMVQVGFQEAHDRLHTVIDGVEVYLCHRPEFKLDAFYPKALNICGHVHDSWTLNKGIHNVSVEVRNYRPVTIAQIQLDTEDEV